jgi:mRNA interferase MazF
MVSPIYVPERGHFVWIDFNPQTGREQAGHRPALVLSVTEYNRATGLAVMCPITSRQKGYPFEVAIPDGLSITGFVLADSVKNLDWRTRPTRFAGPATPDLVDAVLGRLADLLVIKVG